MSNYFLILNNLTIGVRTAVIKHSLNISYNDITTNLYRRRGITLTAIGVKLSRYLSFFYGINAACLEGKHKK